jgi:hypothetical protein
MNYYPLPRASTYSTRPSFNFRLTQKRYFILMNESHLSDDIPQGFLNQKGCAPKKEVWKCQVAGFSPWGLSLWYMWLKKYITLIAVFYSEGFNLTPSVRIPP